MAEFLLRSSPATEDRGFLSIAITQDVARPRRVECASVDGLATALKAYADEIRRDHPGVSFVVMPTVRSGRKPAGYDKRWTTDLRQFYAAEAPAAVEG